VGVDSTDLILLNPVLVPSLMKRDVRPLLQAPGGLEIMILSRARVGIPSEHVDAAYKLEEVRERGRGVRILGGVDDPVMVYGTANDPVQALAR
jgi:hypothetical protein